MTFPDSSGFRSVRRRVVLLALTLAAASRAAAAETAVSTVVRLYQDFGWETVIVDPRLPGLIDQPRGVLRRYFDGRLTDLILRDRECARTTHEVCALDFMPLWDGQDAGATELAVRATSDPSVVEVTFRFAEESRKKKLTYRLARSGTGWRIGNIRSPEWSLLSILEKKP